MITGSINDAGRNESGVNEKNDCTIRAYALMTGKTYTEAWIVLALAGRKNRRRTNVHLELYNKEFDRYPRPGMTVKSFIESVEILNTRWIIRVRGHVFCVIGKEILDTNPMGNLNCHVISAWKIKS